MTKSMQNSVMIRMNAESKQLLEQAAELRKISLSDYIRTVMVPQAEREVESAQSQTIAMSAAEQMTFWEALQKPVKLTSSQKKLGKMMRNQV